MTASNEPRRAGGSDDNVAAAPAGDSVEAAKEALLAEWEEEKVPPAGRTANLVVAAIVVITGIAGIVGSLGLGLGIPEKPAPGMWPFIVSVILLLLGVSLAVFDRNATDTERFSASTWMVVIGVATLIGLVILVPMIGFEVPSLVLTFVWLRFLGKETWKSSILLSVVIVAVFYAIFVLALSVPLPHLF